MTILNPPKIQQNSLASDVEFKDAMEIVKTDAMNSINCHHIGTIQSFNASNQTATATINYTKTLFNYNNATKAYVPVTVNYPILTQCPVICLGGGAANLTFPIQKGDECLVLFNDRSIDNWLQTGQVGPVNSPRMHALADGIILVGLRNEQRSIQNYDTTRAVITDGNAKCGVNPSTHHVTIVNNSTTLKTVLNNLISAATGATYGGNPIDSSATGAFATVVTQIGTLLE